MTNPLTPAQKATINQIGLKLSKAARLMEREPEPGMSYFDRGLNKTVKISGLSIGEKGSVYVDDADGVRHIRPKVLVRVDLKLEAA